MGYVEILSVGGGNSTLRRCPFGLRLRPGNVCESSDTYAAAASVPYNVLRVACCVLGLVALLASMAKLYHIRRGNGSTIQGQVYWLLVVASLTFVVRAVDPLSYDYIYPPAVSGALSDVCSACLYTIMTLYAAFYTRVAAIAPTAASHPVDLTHEHATYTFVIQGFQWLAIFLTWTVFVAVRLVYLLLNPPQHNFDAWHVLMQDSMAPLLLLGISTTALVFGLRIYRRLRHIQEANARAAIIASVRHNAAAAQFGPNPPDRRKSPVATPTPEPIFLVDELNQGTIHHLGHSTSMASSSSASERRAGWSVRILRVVMLMEAYAVAAIALHITRLVRFVAVDDCRLAKEHMASSSVSAFAMDVPVEPMVQFVGVVLMYWSFRKTKPSATEPAQPKPADDPLLEDQSLTSRLMEHQDDHRFAAPPDMELTDSAVTMLMDRPRPPTHAKKSRTHDHVEPGYTLSFPRHSPRDR